MDFSFIIKKSAFKNHKTVTQAHKKYDIILSIRLPMDEETKMEKKKFIVGVVILTVVSLLLAFGVTGISSGIKGSLKAGSDEKNEQKSIIGEWVDKSGVDIQFTDKNVFQMFGDDVANYTMDTKTKTITIKYAQAYGGQQTNMAYTLDGNTLTMKDTATGDTNTYTKKQ